MLILKVVLLFNVLILRKFQLIFNVVKDIVYRLDKNKLNLTTVNYQENISEEVKRIARIALERGQDAIKNRKSSTGGPTMEEIEKELGGIDGFFTLFGCHYVGMFSNPRMNVLFDTSHKNDANSNALDHGKRVASSLLDLKFGTTYFGSLGRSHHLARVAVQGSHMKVNVLFIPFFVFVFLVTFSDEVTKIQKYYVIFVYILQGKMGKTEKTRKENHATKVTKIPKTKR